MKVFERTINCQSDFLRRNFFIMTPFRTRQLGSTREGGFGIRVKFYVGVMGGTKLWVENGSWSDTWVGHQFSDLAFNRRLVPSDGGQS